MSGYWNHTTQTGLFQGRNGGQSRPYQDDDPGFNVLARDAEEVILGQGPYIDNVRPGQEALGLYPAVDTALTPPDKYYLLDATTPYTFALTGTEFQTGATVERTHNWVSLNITQIYERKRAEVGAYDAQVRYNAVDTSLSVNWWIIVTQAARFEILGIASASNSREIRSQAWPTGPNAPWIGIFNAANGNAQRQQVTAQATWDTIEQEIVQHDQACGNATEASRSALEAAYNGGAGDINAVRNHDPASPTWGYPPTVTLPPEVAALFQ